jgi:hypothetical protein
MTAAAWIALVALVAAMTQLWFLNRHTREFANHTSEFAKQAAASAEAATATAEAIRASVHINMAQMMIGIDRIFLERPDLRAEFYGLSGQPDRRRHEAEAAAEILVDFAECFLGQRNYMPGEFTEYWQNYFRDIMSSSAAFREFWDKHSTWYGESVREFLEPVRQAAA